MKAVMLAVTVKG